MKRVLELDIRLIARKSTRSAGFCAHKIRSIGSLGYEHVDACSSVLMGEPNIQWELTCSLCGKGGYSDSLEHMVEW